MQDLDAIVPTRWIWSKEKSTKSQKLCLVAKKITKKHKEEREREKEPVRSRERCELWKRARVREPLNVLNSLRLKWAFIQYIVIVFQRFTTVDTKFKLFCPQLIKLLINLLSLLTPLLLRCLKKKTKTKYFLILFSTVITIAGISLWISLFLLYSCTQP